MTLDEAIKHAEEVAEEQKKLCKQYDEASRYYRSHNEDMVSANAKKCLECFECAAEHRQLAEWLKDYKRLLEQEPKWIPVSERLPEKNVWVLVTVKQSDKHYQEIMRRNKYIEAWADGIDNYTDEIIAWMPLPEPYKAESEDNE